MTTNNNNNNSNNPPTSTDVSGWSIDQVASWASSKFSAQTVQKLRDQEVSGNSLLVLTFDKLTNPPFNIPGGPAQEIASFAVQLQSAPQVPSGSSLGVPSADDPSGDSQLLREIKRVNARLDKIEERMAQKNMDEESDIDDWTHVSSEAPKSWKGELLAYYDMYANTDGRIKCMVLDKWYPERDVRAAHLSMRHTKGRTLAKLGLRRNDLQNVRNGLLLYNTIENAFDVKRVCFLYDPFKRVLVLHVLDPALKNQIVVDDITFDKIHNSPLVLPDGKWPYRRVLNMHARKSFKVAQQLGWIPADRAVFDFFDLSDSVPDYRFPNPNKSYKSYESVLQMYASDPRLKLTAKSFGVTYDVVKYHIDVRNPEFAQVSFGNKSVYMRVENLCWELR